MSADSSGRRNTYYKLSMWSDDYDKKYVRVGFTSAQKTELWERWRSGEQMKSIGRELGKRSSSEEQIIAILKEQENGLPTKDVCRRHGISSATFYKWKSKYGGLNVSDARNLKALEAENNKLKKLLAEQMLDNAMLKDINSKNGDARG